MLRSHDDIPVFTSGGRPQVVSLRALLQAQVSTLKNPIRTHKGESNSNSNSPYHSATDATLNLLTI